MGVRADLIHRPRWSVYGRLLPGLLRFGETLTALRSDLELLPTGPVVVITDVLGPATQFALTYGTGVALRLGGAHSACRCEPYAVRVRTGTSVRAAE